MRLLRVGPPGRERPAALLEDGSLVDLSPVTGELDGAFLAGGGLERARDALDRGGLPALDAGERVGPPVARPGKVVCIGLNYRDHAEETGAPLPAEPVLFLKDPGTVVGPDDQVLVPRGSSRTDYEVELAVVIGRRARYLAGPEAAGDHVAGYAVANDVSEREFQLERNGSQWDKGKSCETFNPLGPWLVTPDQAGDPQRLGLRTWVNGELRQNGNTHTLIFDVAAIIAFLTQQLTLEPGDVISTGTPAGVAMGQPDPKPYLRAGDVVELEIEGLGRQRQVFGAA